MKLLFTNKQMKERNKELLTNLFSKYKAAYIAGMIGAKVNTIWQMKQRGYITDAYVVRISEALEIPISELRCDYGHIVEKAVFEK